MTVLNFEYKVARVEPTRKTFGDWLKAERERKNLTQTALATAAGVSAQYVHNLETNLPNKSGKLTKPSSAVCRRFAAALGVHYLEALRAADHLPQDIPGSEVRARMAADYVAALPDEKQDEAISYLKFLFENFGDAGTIRDRSPKHPAVVREGESHPPPVASTTPQLEGQPPSAQKKPGKHTDSERTAKNGSE